MAKPKKRSIKVQQGLSGMFGRYSDYLHDTFDKAGGNRITKRATLYPKKVEQDIRNKAKSFKSANDNYFTPETILTNSHAYDATEDFKKQNSKAVDAVLDYVPIIGGLNRFGKGDKVQGVVDLTMDALGAKSIKNLYRFFRSGNKLRKLRFLASGKTVAKREKELDKALDSFSYDKINRYITPEEANKINILSERRARKSRQHDVIQQLNKSIPKLMFTNAVKAGSQNYLSNNHIYEAIDPYDSYSMKKALRNVFVGRKAIFADDNTITKHMDAQKAVAYYKDKDNFENLDFDKAMHNYVDRKAYINQSAIADELLAMYLGIPESRRHFDTRLEKSEYRKGSYKLPITGRDWERLYEALDKYGVYLNKNAVTDIIGGYGLNQHALGHGFDENGEYISYGDSYDLNPFRGWATNIEEIGWTYKYPALRKRLEDINDLSLGIYNPIEIYDRKYLDDLFRVPTKTHALYLPNVTITGIRLRPHASAEAF